MASTISAELNIIGDLKSDGDIEIDGRVEGRISGRGVTDRKSVV
jgi:cytoskeletal protein CcmA (bactofilin family)